MPSIVHKMPTTEQIEERARQLHLQRGSPKGDELADWLAAEKELKELLNAQDRPANAQNSEPPARPSANSMLLDYYCLLYTSPSPRD